jgi:hypothetical protein
LYSGLSVSTVAGRLMPPPKSLMSLKRSVLIEHAAGGVGLDLQRQREFLVHRHHQPVVGHLAGLGLERQQVGVALSPRRSTSYSSE